MIVLSKLKVALAVCLASAALVSEVTSANSNTARLALPLSTDAPIILRLNVTPKDKDPRELIQVFIGSVETCCDGKIPVAGRHEFVGKTVQFTPAFGFSPSQSHVVRIRNTDDTVELYPFTLATAPPTPTASITDVYPSAAVLPENLLRFYIHFTKPMTPHVAFDYITLRNVEGDLDNQAFMRFKQELWNSDRTRLTVLFDPGRIKRNVATNLELGPALQEDEHYSLVVKSGWPSADGRSLLPGFSKSFRVSKALRTKPDIQKWHIGTLCIGTRNALEILLDRPFDRHQLTHSVWLASETNDNIPSTVQIGKDERSLQLVPKETWVGKVVYLVVNTALEDVAGNNFRDLLDHDKNQKVNMDAVISMALTPENCNGK